MKGAILAGGKGERLYPLTKDLPKPMVEIAGKPLLGHQINLFSNYGIKDLLLCLHYLPEKIIKYFGDGKKFGVNITYSIEKHPMGTAGALKNSENFFNDAFIVSYGDNLTNLNLKKLVDFHNKKNGLATIALFKKLVNQKSSSMVIMDENSRIRKFIERPFDPDTKQIRGKYKFVNAGFYVLEHEVLNFIPKRKFDFAYELFPLLLRRNKKLFGYVIPADTYLKEIGTIKKLKSVQEYAKSQI